MLGDTVNSDHSQGLCAGRVTEHTAPGHTEAWLPGEIQGLGSYKPLLTFSPPTVQPTICFIHTCV